MSILCYPAAFPWSRLALVLACPGSPSLPSRRLFLTLAASPPGVVGRQVDICTELSLEAVAAPVSNLEGILTSAYSAQHTRLDALLLASHRFNLLAQVIIMQRQHG